MASITAALLIKALDGLSLRAKVTAENIANASTPNYRPLRVSFEQALADAAAQGASAIQAVEPKIVSDANANSDPDLRLDLELTTAATTSDRYGALIDVLSRQMQLSELALSGSAS